MSTMIKSCMTSRTIEVGVDGEGVKVQIADLLTDPIFITRTDFLAAVATECNVRIVAADAIVIERGELPEVQAIDRGDRISSGSDTYISSAGWADVYRKRARTNLALAAYLDANPPVDEAQVDFMVAVIREQHAWGSEASQDIARRLYLAGARIKAAK